ncbi:MAG: S9 family peptidase [Saprospiraceae bacterium]|nr:S9 family peptidase [Saprospiraceae bacterium]
MRTKIIFIATLLCSMMMQISCTVKNKNVSKVDMNVKQPLTKRDETVKDNFFGTTISDPYRWLEDENSSETKKWIKDQNEYTKSILDKIPYRNDIKESLTKLMNYERYSAPFYKNGKYYFFKNDGLQNQAVLYESESLEGPEIEFLNPNNFSKDGTSSLGSYSFSPDKRHFAYQVSEAGSDWQTIYVMDLMTNKITSDTIKWVKFSDIAWIDQGFVYSRYPDSGEKALTQKNENHQVYYHALGTSQAMDKLIYQDKEHPLRNAYATATDDQQYLIISISESTSGNSVIIKNINTDDPTFKSVINDFENDFDFVTNDGSLFYFLTNKNATNKTLIAIDFKKPESKNWKTIIPANEDVLESVTCIDNKFVAKYTHNAYHTVSIFEKNGKKIKDVKLPGIGSISSINGEKEDKLGFFSFTSFTQPSSSYMLNMEDYSIVLYKAPSLKFDFSKYETKQVWYSSKDGTKVPMFITYKKGIELDGKHPTWLYGYGGFNISVLPSFKMDKMILLENGGVYAVANIRGGGEFGSDWHKSGTLEKKQNVFDDFISAAEYLIQDGYTSKDYLAIEGRSNGGLLIGACMTQRPDLFRVAFPSVGVLDMLRYHKFTIGWAWASDYGRSDDKEAFPYLIKYSPLHNVKSANYPATMVITADHDDRVVPAHSFKFGSELQYKNTGKYPITIRIESAAGHGAGKPISKSIDESADMLGFMFYNMGFSSIKLP